MLLKVLFEGTEVLEASKDLNVEVSDIFYDSRKVKPGSLYVCLKGFFSDGHSFVKEALKNGAVAILASEKIDTCEAVVIYVEDTRKTLADISSAFFENPSKKIKTIGVTGTKGKTTCAFMIRSILAASGKKTGVIGTIGVVFEDDEIIKLANTTPESYEIQKYMKEMINRGFEYVVIETSSLGLKFNRVDAIDFDYGVFTNFSSDHIGGNEHKDLNEYLKCKSILFKKSKTGILNIDESKFDEILKKSLCKNIITFGFSENAQIKAQDSRLLSNKKYLGVRFDLIEQNIKTSIDVAVPGKFSVYNALAAIAVCRQLNVNYEAILEGLSNVKVRGRVEIVSTPFDYTLIIDFAHNALSMESILKTLKEYKPNRIIVLFGSGGERPKIRRFEMGKKVGELADFSVITSDNPRSENELEIIEDIKSGIENKKHKFAVFPDRKDAIKYAMKIAEPNDIVLLAGKGHEDYQYTKNGKEQFDEREVVKKILKQSCSSILEA